MKKEEDRRRKDLPRVSEDDDLQKDLLSGSHCDRERGREEKEEEKKKNCKEKEKKEKEKEKEKEN